MNQRTAITPVWGAWPAGEGQVRFALWAPAAKNVDVVFDTGARSALQAGQDGFFSAVIDCAPGARYRYSIDGGEPVPDPASRWQPEAYTAPVRYSQPMAMPGKTPGGRGGRGTKR